MEHIGIDLGSKESQVCVRTADGTIIGEWRLRMDGLIRFLEGRPAARVILETCTEAFRVAMLAQRAGHDVRVVAATLVRALGVGHRGLKNDVRDARVLSEASCRMDLPSVHIPTAISQEVKAICVSREALIKTRTQLIGRVRGYVRARLGRPLRATPESLPKRVREALLDDAEGLPAHLERVLVALETISQQIAEADTELRMLAHADERMTRLMTVPGVGPVTAARFVAAIDDVGRFPTAASVASYLGLVPGEDTTGFRTKRTRLTRAGAPQVRWALGQAAWSLYIRRKTDPMVRWAKQIADRRGSQVAIMALARKLAHVLYALWKHEATYDPSRAARLGITCSMSRRGNCYDNAVMEAFFSSVKSEVADRFDSSGEARIALFEYLEVFYNQRRRHSTLGQISPAAFERQAGAQGVDAAVPMDAKNAPTGTWKTAQNAVSHSAHTPHNAY